MRENFLPITFFRVVDIDRIYNMVFESILFFILEINLVRSEIVLINLSIYRKRALML